MGQESPFDPTKAYEYMERRVQERTLELKKAYEYMEHRLKQRSDEMEVLYQQLRTQVRERRNLLGRIITAQEEERRRIARELHDEVSQTLTGLVMSLGSTEALAGLEPAARQRLKSLRNLTSEAVEEVRRLIRDLRPSLLDDLGLVAAISWYVENYLATAGVKAELDTHGFDRRLPPTVEITLFRVVQEAITNIVKHAEAKTARIYLKRAGSTIVGSIEDSGVGFDADALRREQSGGMAVGLLGMEERINLLEGKLKIESRPGGGTRVYFEIPWQESDSEKDSYSYS
jgi:two-component system sensor histidine kinase UhpB